MPELAYEPFKDEKHRMWSWGRKPHQVQTGYYERLLCTECESRLSVYETEFKKTWMDTIPHDLAGYPTRTLRDAIYVSIPDFRRFKLFHLSVIWRSAVSRLKPPVGNITLGPYERQIAQMLLDGDAGSPGDFFFFAALNLDPQKRPVAVVVPIAQGEGRINGHRYYGMSYAYCDWTFVIAKPGPPWLVELESHCRESNRFPLLVQPHGQSKMFRFGEGIVRLLQRQNRG